MGKRVYLATLVVLVTIGAYILQRLDLKWDLVNADLLSASSSSYVTDKQLLIIRLVYLSIILYSVLFSLFDKKGNVLRVETPEKEIKKVHLIGVQRFSAFTAWCWSLQCLYFLLTSGYTLAKFYSPPALAFLAPFESVLTRVAWGAFEISFAMSFLVSSVVTFVLIPTARRKGLPHDNFYSLQTQLMHNANVAFMVSELFLNKLPIILEHNILCFFWGISYTFFAMYWFKLHGFYYYFFLDNSKPFAPLWTVGLIGVYSIFFSLGHVLSGLIRDPDSASGNFYMLCVFAYTLLCMKFPPKDQMWVLKEDICKHFPYLSSFSIFNTEGDKLEKRGRSASK
jgi:hypothetical protein